MKIAYDYAKKVKVNTYVTLIVSSSSSFQRNLLKIVCFKTAIWEYQLGHEYSDVNDFRFIMKHLYYLLVSLCSFLWKICKYYHAKWWHIYCKLIFQLHTYKSLLNELRFYDIIMNLFLVTETTTCSTIKRPIHIRFLWIMVRNDNITLYRFFS